MKPEIKAKWLAALRGGKYSQGKDHLKTKRGSFCCLGVLTDIYAKSCGKEWVESEEDFRFGRHHYYLPSEVMKWAGIKDKKALLSNHPTYGDLAQANDRGARFKVIANLIEKYL